MDDGDPHDYHHRHHDPSSSSSSLTHVPPPPTTRPSADHDDDDDVRQRVDHGDDEHDVVDDNNRRPSNNRRSSSMPESSEYAASQSSSYEKPSSSDRRYPGDERQDHRRNGSVKRGQLTRSFSNSEAPADDKIDGSLSDTAVGLHPDDNARRESKRSSSNKGGGAGGGSGTDGGGGGGGGSSSGGRSGAGGQYQSGSGGMGKKSNSTSQLSATVGEEGRKRRLGFGKKGKSSFTVHRSEEVLPDQQAQSDSGRSARQPSSASSDGEAEGSGDGDSWSPGLRTYTDPGQLNEFIEGLGPGQLVGRQVLGAPALGDIQLSLSNTKGYLEVEVVRARDLQNKPGSRVLPAPYVKVYLVNGKKCIAKAKTATARKTLEPMYQQPLAFRENFNGCILQVTVWGDYGRLEGKKVFMGVAQIMLDNLNLNEVVFGWYKLFGTTSLVSGPPSIGLSRRSSAASLDSLKF
ncbi:regulating synaptic membrane exocytosis protein 3-like [Trichogramma pretiosum]|uniref:regulating synaptic membrane exocytosis protein 3-like n=1 Tax=Trichogramma pretiosum TaxID=7493 RepID=UPI000C71C106|nr:regulating synaptic membrane exocytosis protein 3-like [Trichogramma pretiosum]